MKKVLICSFIFFIMSCKSNYTASEMVLKKIKTAEKITNKNSSEGSRKVVDNFLGNLSGIECAENVELYHQFYGVPTKETVGKWKKWYEENKDNFYFYYDYECFDILHISKKDRKKIVFLKSENSNEIKSSLSEDKILSCNKLKTSISIK